MHDNLDSQPQTKGRFRHFSLRVVAGSSDTTLLPGPHILAVNTTANTTAIQEVALLPEQQTLVVDQILGGITLVDWRSGRFLAHTNVSDQQLPVILYLLEEWPSYIPFEKVLHRCGLELTAQQLEDIERIKVAGYAGESDEEKALDKEARQRIVPFMKPIRTLLAGCNPHLREFGIIVAEVLDCGPLLMKAANKKPTIVPAQNVN